MSVSVYKADGSHGEEYPTATINRSRRTRFGLADALIIAAVLVLSAVVLGLLGLALAG